MMTVNTDLCIGCGKCLKDCFPNDIELTDGKAHVKNEACFKCGHCIAVCPVGAISTDEYSMEDVKEYNAKEFQIEPERLMNFIQFRRSIRQFKAEPVAKEDLARIIEAGRFTQTGTNSQDVAYTVVTDKLPELKEMVLKTLDAMGDHFLSMENPDARYLRYAGFWKAMYKAYTADPVAGDKLFFNAPAIVVVSAVSPLNGALASSNMELMTNALGLGTFFSGFFAAAAEQNPAIKELLGLKEGRQLISCMVIGHPAVSYKRTVPRKSAEILWT